ncbi:MAG: class B sortase [Lachnospiraceae bacterium]|nr:class B sortase [Lachnospiraceae bacterium]
MDQYEKSLQEYSTLQDTIEETETLETAPLISAEIPSIPENYPQLRLDFDSLSSLNPDTVAWIYVDALDVSYPVVQTVDDEIYLHKSFGGEENIAGCIFLDAYNNPDFTSMNTFIFGHNMRNGTMFGKLKNFYQDETAELCNSAPWIYIFQKEQVIKYQIFSYYLVQNTSDIYRDVNTEEEYDEYIEEVTRLSLYKDYDLEQLNAASHILTLSTCSGTSGSKRFIVQAVEVERINLVGSDS